MITARITDLIKLCQRQQEGDCVSAQWFQDIRSALKREVQIGLEEAMANSPADDALDQGAVGADCFLDATRSSSIWSIDLEGDGSLAF